MPTAPRTPSRHALALAALLLAGCAKDLELPPLGTAPVLAALSPARVWAGQLVRIEGTGLDPDPGANVVTFAGATARGLRFDGPALVVRVPADAGSGPVIVTNGRGTSDPFGSLEYLGLGEPRRRAVATRRPILHGPLAVHAIGGETFIHSALYGGLLAPGDPALASPPAVLTAAAPWKGALYVTERADRDTLLWRVDAVTGALRGPRALPFAPTQLLAMRRVDAVVALGNDGTADALAAWDLDTLTTVVPPAPLGLGAFFRAADVGDGRAVAVAYDEQFTAVTLALLDVERALAGPLPPPVLLPGGFEPSLALLVAVAGIETPQPLAAVTLSGGDLLVARLDAADPAFVGTVATFSPAAIEGLAGAATHPIVLATKQGDGLSVGADLQARALLWSVPGNAPGPASATGDVAVVAHAADNDVSVVNLATGSRIARVNFDVGPGGPGAGGFAAALAFLPRDPADSSSEDALYLLAASFPGLLRFPTGGGAASCVDRAAGIVLVAASAEAPAVWGARTGSPAAIDAFVGRGAASPATVLLPGVTEPTHLAASGSSLLVGHGGELVGGGGGLSLLEGSRLAGTAAIAGAAGFHGLGFAPDGHVWAVPQIGSETVAQLWEPAQIGSGGAASLSVSLGSGSSSSALWLEDGLWVLGLGRPPAAALLGSDLEIARTVSLVDGAPVVAAVSPNGRLLVERVLGGAAGETLLRFYRADPDAGFPRIDAVVVEGNVEGLAFDDTGERLWVSTRGPDRVVLID